MDANRKTALSAGAVIRLMLLSSEAVASRVTKVYPVATDKAVLPYIVTRRVSLITNPTKSGYPGADTAQYEVACFAARYADSVDLAEAAREALESRSYTSSAIGLTLRHCHLVEAVEEWADDAYCQILTFNVNV